MKVSRLYLKILLAFILVLLLAIAGIAGLVKMGHMRPPFTLHAKHRIVALKQLIRLEIDGATTLTPQLRDRLSDLLDIYSKAFRGEAWIVDERGRTVIRSSSAPLPLTGDEEMERKLTTEDGDLIYFVKKGDQGAIYAYGDLKTPLGPLTVHLLNEWIMRNEEIWFIKGLALMATVAALLLIPVSRHITRPVNRMTESARQLAMGDFSPRVEEIPKDELGALARTFNHMADSLEKMVRGGRELTANLSHELRSPLARIRVSQQIIRERLESGRTDGVKKHVLRMEEEIDHMDSLIDQIMRLSKLDLQESPSLEDVVDMGEMLEEAVERVRPLIGERTIPLRLERKPAPACRCRRQALRIVLDNVLANAVKYSPDGSPVTVRCGERGGAVVVEVTNEYRSLTEAELEAIFVPFKRLGYDQVEGNGLGLAFARRIVGYHGGTIRAASVEAGFRMTITLPPA